VKGEPGEEQRQSFSQQEGDVEQESLQLPLVSAVSYDS
jgi:hypothetical protein